MIINYLRAITRLFYKGNLGPLYLIHFITNKCNAKCKHCFYWQSLNTHEKTLTVEEIDKMTKHLGRMLFVNLTGGEPFLRPDVAEIAKVYYKNTKPINITIPTNGILTEKIAKDTEEILRACPRTTLAIKFSIDGTEKTHDDIRGFAGIFNSLLNTYNRLNELKKNYHNLDIYFTTVVSSANQNNLDDLFNFMKENLKDNTWLVLLARGDTKDPTIKNFDEKIYKAFAEKIRNTFGNKSRLFFSELLLARDKVSDDIVYKTTVENKYLSPCYAGRTAGVIDENGNIKPCEILSDTFGNIRDYDYNFKKLWTDVKAKKIRKKILDTKCFCTHECFVGNNVIFNLMMWPKIIAKLLRK
ncbi:radical SAM protein [Candidatus Wolfebacteria bacterium]|nr:radical SAM protein [Candidatus Magasanikbacteria bacterium]MBI5401610.1 radical SAM protein [Candidatus Wolfebacteria bacterium]